MIIVGINKYIYFSIDFVNNIENTTFPSKIDPIILMMVNTIIAKLTFSIILIIYFILFSLCILEILGIIMTKIEPKSVLITTITIVIAE